jgi:HAD superfamily hydrolase (TIGR01509 family)
LEEKTKHKIMTKKIEALIFDCDGVLVDTERDGHRVAFNRAFKKKGIEAEWSVEEYGELVKIAGGKERMKYYFDKNGWPKQFEDREQLIKDMHKLKTDLFMQIIEAEELPLRPGVARLVDEAISENIKLAVCSTSNERAVNLIVSKLLGSERQKHFNVILAGDVVTHKKPNPEIYHLAQKHLNVNASHCVVIEDSNNGLRAAKGAGMNCIVTINGYSENENFTLADLVVPELGDGEKINVTIKTADELVIV